MTTASCSLVPRVKKSWRFSKCKRARRASEELKRPAIERGTKHTKKLLYFGLENSFYPMLFLSQIKQVKVDRVKILLKGPIFTVMAVWSTGKTGDLNLQLRFVLDLGVV